MANPIIKILRGATAPSATLQAGQLAMDQVAKNLYLGVEVGGVVTNEIVGGEGTFATKTYVDSAISAGTGSLGTMSTQNADSVAITGGSLNNSVNALFINGAEISSSPIDNCAIGANIASTGKFTSLDVTVSDINMSGSGLIDMNTGRIINLGAPLNANDSVRLTDLDTAISALGSVFHYVGDLSTNINAINPLTVNDLTLANDQTTGSYYRVNVAGTYTAGSDSFALKVGDAIVKTSTGWQKLDNVDVVVSGTTDEIAVTGDENAGYTVALATEFKDKVSDLETKTQNITAITGETYVAGILTSQELWVGPSSSDAVKLLNPVAGPASIEAPSGKQLVIKNGEGNTAITLPDSGLGRVEFAYDVSVAAVFDTNILNANSASLGSIGVNGSALFSNGITVASGNLVGTGTNEITDFIIDGGVY